MRLTMDGSSPIGFVFPTLPPPLKALRKMRRKKSAVASQLVAPVIGVRGGSSTSISYSRAKQWWTCTAPIAEVYQDTRVPCRQHNPPWCKECEYCKAQRPTLQSAVCTIMSDLGCSASTFLQKDSDWWTVVDHGKPP